MLRRKTAKSRLRNSIDAKNKPRVLNRIVRIQQSSTDCANFRPLNVLGQVTYWDTAGVRLRTLLAPRPEQDLDTVVLVTNR